MEFIGKIFQGSVFDVLPTIPKGSCDICVTSPPYWALRSYLPKGHPLKPLELGGEKTPREYVANMVRVFQLVRDCLADHGTLWLIVGDTFSGTRHWGGQRPIGPGSKVHQPSYDDLDQDRPASSQVEIEDRNLCLIPQRLAVALQDDGWIVRSYIIWHKPASMPCSVSGWSWRRCRVRDPKFKQHRYKGKGADGDDLQSPGERIKMNVATARANGRSHECSIVSDLGWIDCDGCKRCKPNGGYVLRKGRWRPTVSYEPVLMLAKTGEYFSDGEPVKTLSLGNKGSSFTDERDLLLFDGVGLNERDDSDLANLRDVWRIAAEPLNEKHYAAFPTELVRLCLQAGTSAKGYCKTCRSPWVRMIDSKAVPHPRPGRIGRDEVDTKGGAQADGDIGWRETKTVGWRPTCQCEDNEPRPGIVLDPFSGSGRTSIAAQRLGLDYIGIELNPEYVAMSERLIHDDAPLFSAKQ